MKELKNLLIALNSTKSLFKYPIGNRELTTKIKDLEMLGKIRFNEYQGIWQLNKK